VNITAHLRTLLLATASATIAGSAIAQRGGDVARRPDSNDIWVTPGGSFGPTGSTTNPFAFLLPAISRSETWSASEEIILKPGTYHTHANRNRDTQIETPCLLMTDGTGPADIGPPLNTEETIFTFMTANIHLFGDGSNGGVCSSPCLAYWADWYRASVIGDSLGQWGADVLCLQEVWDDDMVYLILEGAARHGYIDYYYGTGRDDWDDCLHSGLLILSRHPIVPGTEHRGYYAEESGWDKWASKGWIRCQVMLPDGRTIGIFNTHTQADAEEYEDRWSQMWQLANDVLHYRETYPGDPVFVGGDFNVASESTNCTRSKCWEYWNNMGHILPSVGLRDAHRNGEHYFANKENHPYPPYTAEHTNELYAFWSPGYPDELLDYILWTDGWSGVQPRGYARIVRQRSPGYIRDDAIWNEGTCDWEPLESWLLSDHHALWMRFTLFSAE